MFIGTCENCVGKEDCSVTKKLHSMGALPFSRCCLVRSPSAHHVILQLPFTVLYRSRPITESSWQQQGTMWIHLDMKKLMSTCFHWIHLYSGVFETVFFSLVFLLHTVSQIAKTPLQTSTMRRKAFKTKYSIDPRKSLSTSVPKWSNHELSAIAHWSSRRVNQAYVSRSFEFRIDSSTNKKWSIEKVYRVESLVSGKPKTRTDLVEQKNFSNQWSCLPDPVISYQKSTLI